MKLPGISILLFTAFIFSSFYKRPIVWVAIGDSFTYLNDHADETGGRVSQGYMTMVVNKLSNIQVVNQGHNGWTTGNIAEKIDSIGLVSADVYSVLLGTNDWWQGRPLGTIHDFQNNTGNGTFNGSFRIIINKLKSLNPSAKIILITPMQRTDFVYVNDPTNNAHGSYKQKNGQNLEQFCNAIEAIGKVEKLDVINLFKNKKLSIDKLVKFKHTKDPATGKYKNLEYPHYVNVPFNPESDEYPYPVKSINITYDGLHPSDKGNKVIAKELVKKLRHLN